MAMPAQKKARNSLNGDPQWSRVGDGVRLQEDVVQGLKGHGELLNGTNPIVKVAHDVGLGPTLQSLDGGGGGWVMAGPKPGQTSKITYDITWKLKCKSNHHYGCPAKLNVVFINHSKSLVVEHAKGWLHSHSGESNAKKGLPPDVKLLIDDLVKKNPTMKFGGVCNVLFEQHRVPTEMRERISNYYYKGAGARNASHSALLGVSSYGCVSSWVAVNGLERRLIEHRVDTNQSYLDVPGVLGSEVKPEEKRCMVFVSTPRLLLTAWFVSTLGYSTGAIHSDHTFKLLHEDIPFLVTSTTDIGQHVRPIGVGPTTHMDKEMTAAAFTAQKEWTDKLLAFVAADNVNQDGWPDGWPAELHAALREMFNEAVQAAMHRDAEPDEEGDVTVLRAPTYKVTRSMSDAAPALSNAAIDVFGASVTVMMCWVHVWRAVKNKHSLLVMKTEEREKELYTDLAFIHHLDEVQLVAPALQKFDDKWRNALKEVQMANYIKSEWSTKRWQRAYGPPGEPTDNNTLESLNRVLKGDENFSKKQAIGHALPHLLTVVHRMSRDAKPVPLSPINGKKEWAAAQKLADGEVFKLAFKCGNAVVIPSSKLLAMREIASCKTIGEKRQAISTWIKEYITVRKNPGGSRYVHGDASWDFDLLMDYAFSFWTIEPISPFHPSAAELAKQGIIYKCNCPKYTHYHTCQHALGYAIFKSEQRAPTEFSTAIVGKRAAPAGATLSQRGHCLSIA